MGHSQSQREMSIALMKMNRMEYVRNYKKSTEQLEHCWNALQLKEPPEPQADSSMDGKATIKIEPESDGQEDLSNVPNCNEKPHPCNPFSYLSKKPPGRPRQVFRKPAELDLSIKEKLDNIPAYDVRGNSVHSKIDQNKAYPWQNFNVDTLLRPKYKIIKPVNNITKEILTMSKKPILRKADTFKPVRKKEVKFNTNPTFMVYPKKISNTPFINSQPRINLSTNCPNVIKNNPGIAVVKVGSKVIIKRSRILNQKCLSNKRKVGQAKSSRQKSASPSNNEELYDETVEKYDRQVKQKRSSASIFGKRKHIKLFRPVSQRSHFSMMGTSSKKSFYSSHSDKNSTSYYSKKNEYYLNGIKQCNKIKNKYKKSYPNYLAYSPDFYKSNSRVIVQPFVGPVTGKSQLELGPIRTKKDPIRNSRSAKNSSESETHHPNKNKKKIKIVYPTSSVKYKQGTYSSSIKNKRYSFFAQQGKRSSATVPLVGKKREKTLSVSSNIISPPPFLDKVKKIVSYNMGEQYQRAEKFEKPSRLITVHPALKRASFQNKMAINKKYNQLLLKLTRSAPIVMRNSINKNQTLQENEPRYQISKIQLDDPPEKQPAILIHPVMNNDPQNNFKNSLRYTKSIVHDKNETFDIDDICLKTKEKYYLSIYKDSQPITKRQLPSTNEVEMSGQLEHPRKTTKNQQQQPLRKQETNATPKKTKESLGKISKVRPVVASKSLLGYLNGWKELPDETRANKLTLKNKPSVATMLKSTSPITKEKEHLSRPTTREVKFKAGICKESNGVIQDNPKRIMIDLEKQTENLTKAIFESEPIKKNEDSSSKETLASINKTDTSKKTSKTTPLLQTQKVLSEEFIDKNTDNNKPVKNVDIAEKLVEVAKARKVNIQPKVFDRNLKGTKINTVEATIEQKNTMPKISKIGDKDNESKVNKQQAIDEEKKTKAKWIDLKDQMRRISLVKKREGVPMSKKGQSQNAHKAVVSDKQKSNGLIPSRAIKEPQTNKSVQPDRKVKAETQSSKISDQLLNYELRDGIDKLKEIKMIKNVKEPFEDIPKKPLMLEMYDKCSQIGQRPPIRREKPQEDDKKEKSKPKNSIRLPPHKEITEKKLEKTTFPQKSTNLGDSKLESKKQTIPESSAAMLPIKGKEKAKNILREQEYKRTYLDLVLKKVKADVFLDDDLDSKVTKETTEVNNAKAKDVEDTNKVNMQPLLTESSNLRKTITKNDTKNELTRESSPKKKFTFNYKKIFYNTNLDKNINDEFEKLHENLQQMKSTKLGEIIDYKKICSNEIADDNQNNILNVIHYQENPNEGLPENELQNFKMQSEKSGEQQRKKGEQELVPVFKDSNHSRNKLGETDKNTESVKTAKKDDKMIKNISKQDGNKLSREVFSNKDIENFHSNAKGSKSDISISYKNLPSRIFEKNTNGPNLEERKSNTPNQKRKKLQLKSGTKQKIPDQTGEQKRSLISNLKEKNRTPSEQNPTIKNIDKNLFKVQFVPPKEPDPVNTVDLDYKSKILDFGLFEDLLQENNSKKKLKEEESFPLTEDVCEKLEHTSKMEVNFNSLKKSEEEECMYTIKSKGKTEMIKSIIKTDADAALNTEKKEYQVFNMSTNNFGNGTYPEPTNFGIGKIPVGYQRQIPKENQYSDVDYQNRPHLGEKIDLNSNNFIEILNSPKSNNNFRTIFDSIDSHMNMRTHTAIKRPGTAANLGSFQISDNGRKQQRSRLTNFEKEMQEFYIPINEKQVLKSEMLSLRPKTTNKNVKRAFRHSMRDGVDFQKQDIQLTFPEQNVRTDFNLATSKFSHTSQSLKRPNFDIADYMNGNISTQKIRLSSEEPSLKTGFSQTETEVIRNLDKKKTTASNLKNSCRPETFKVYNVSDLSDREFLSKKNEVRPKSTRIQHINTNGVKNETQRKKGNVLSTETNDLGNLIQHRTPTNIKQNNKESWTKREICPTCFPKRKKSRDDENKRRVRPDKRNNSGSVVTKLEKREKNKSTLVPTNNDITTKKGTTTKKSNPKNIIFTKNKNNEIIVTHEKSHNTADTPPPTDDSYWGYVNQIVVNVIIPKSSHALNDYFDPKSNEIDNRKISAPESRQNYSHTDNGEEINLMSLKNEAQLPSFEKADDVEVNLGNNIALNNNNLDTGNTESQFTGENVEKPFENIENNMKFDIRNNLYVFPCMRRQKSLEKFAPLDMLRDDVTLNTIDLSNMQKIQEIPTSKKPSPNDLDQPQLVAVPENIKHEDLPSDSGFVRDVLEEFRNALENIFKKKNNTGNKVVSDRENPDRTPINNVKIILDALNDCKMLKNTKKKSETDANKSKDPFNNDFNS